jgi:hypothetical protein
VARCIAAKGIAQDDTATDGSSTLDLFEDGGGTGIEQVDLQRIWRQARLQSHRFGRYMASDDPRFEESQALDPWPGAANVAGRA